MCDDGEICESAETRRQTDQNQNQNQNQNQTQTQTPISATTTAATAAAIPSEIQLQAKKTQCNNITCTEDALLQVEHWQLAEVQQWLGNKEHFSRNLADCLSLEGIDGQVLLALTEEDVRDFRYKLGYKLTFGELKRFWLSVSHLQQQWKLEQSLASRVECSFSPPIVCGEFTPPNLAPVIKPIVATSDLKRLLVCQDCSGYNCGTCREKRLIAPEYFKTAISLGYSFVVTWITSFVMVIVHERVPDMKRYPPLPDIFLDNVPHIPWAFNMCEITGSLLFTVWMMVLIFHKYRMVLLRRFFALAGTVFLLRCVTMLITSLSVPGTHLQCNQKDFAIDDPNVDVFGALVIRMTRAYRIWSGLGMSIQGVRTCGDYMFSGHTVALTLLNFFITEYTPRNLYFLHTLTWLLNMFGIFFILAAHEHYSIDVFVAFYITSRLFLYYHTLANNRALMQSDSTRTRVWFPMFSYFENHMDGMVPNEYDTPGSLIDALFQQLLWIKDQILLAVQSVPLQKAVKAFHPSKKSEDACNHVNPSPSSYFSVHPSLSSGLNTRSVGTTPSTPTKTAPRTPSQPSYVQVKPVKRIDAGVSTGSVSGSVSGTQKTDSRDHKKLL